MEQREESKEVLSIGTTPGEMKPDQRKTVRTGYLELDSLTGGLGRGELILLGGRPAMGKSSFTLNLIRGICYEGSGRAFFFSLELDAEGVRELLRHLGPEEEPEGRLCIFDAPGPSAAEITEFCRKEAENGKPDLIVIDYLQLVGAKRGGDQCDTDRKTILRELKMLSWEMDCPVFVLSNISRKVDGRRERRPQLTDLMDFRLAEQYADMILFLYRKSYYEVTDGSPSEAEVIIARQTAGFPGTAFLMFDPATMRFFSRN